MNTVLAELFTLRIFVFCDYALAALVLFDFLLTLQDEWALIWKSKKNLVFCIFMGIRYGNIGATLGACLSNILPLNTVLGCSALFNATGGMSILLSISISALFSLRTFAIWNHNWVILGALLVTASGKVALSVLELFVYSEDVILTGISALFSTCAQTPRDPIFFAKLETLNNVLVTAFDTIVLTLTLLKTWRSARSSRSLGNGGYLYLFLRDGIVYYLVIESLIVIVIVFTQIEGLELVASVAQIFQAPVSAIIGQRLILGLRRIHAQQTALVVDVEPITMDFGAPMQRDVEAFFNEEDAVDPSRTSSVARLTLHFGESPRSPIWRLRMSVLIFSDFSASPKDGLP